MESLPQTRKIGFSSCVEFMEGLFKHVVGNLLKHLIDITNPNEPFGKIFKYSKLLKLDLLK